MMEVGSEDEPCWEEGVTRGLGLGYSKASERKDRVSTDGVSMDGISV